MSVRVMQLIFAKFPNGGSEMLTMLALADCADDSGGSCYPSMSTIATKTRVTRSQAQRNVHRLIEQGYIAVVGNANGGFHKSAMRRYQFDLLKLTGSTDATGSANATGRTNAQEGPHGCGERGSTDAAQSISEPSMNHQPLVASDADDESAPVKIEKGFPPCPHQEIIAAYMELLPELPTVRIWSGDRKRNLAARWRWVLADKKSSGKPYSKEAGILEFRKLFTYIAGSDFLIGRNGGWTACDLEWLVVEKNFAKVISGKYHKLTN